MPSSSSRRSSRSRQNRKRQPNPNDAMVVASSRAGPSAQTNFPREDFFRRQQSWLLTQQPPRAIGNQIHWISGNNQNTAALSNTAPTELNFAYAFSDLTDLVGLCSYFDQYCIYSVCISATINSVSNFPGAFGSVVTAIDYDNIAALGSFAQVESYQSSLVSKVDVDQTVQRLIHPCVAPALYGGTTFSAYGINRMWCDSASPTIPHYGYRSLWISNLLTSTTCVFDAKYVIGLRNNY